MVDGVDHAITWQRRRDERGARLEAAAPLAAGKIVDARDATRLLEAIIRPGDRVCVEGDNQKQADLLCSALAAVDREKVNGLHMVQSGVVLPEHLDVFERGIAKRLDYAYSAPQSRRIAAMLSAGRIELGAVHTYLELLLCRDADEREQAIRGVAGYTPVGRVRNKEMVQQSTEGVTLIDARVFLAGQAPPS